MTDDRQDDVWVAVWNDVAAQLRMHRSSGRGHLLTEDTVRMSTALALERVGVAPAALSIEVPDPVLSGGKVDLVVERAGARAVVELKYPRGSRSGVSPDTMTLGELLRDFLRVALIPAADRWVVIVLAPELRRYLSRRGTALWVDSVGHELLLERDALESLPKTARDAIGPLAWLMPVRARCIVATPVDVNLSLFAYRVGAPPTGAVPEALAAAREVPSVVPTAGSAARGIQVGTARSQILEAIRMLVSRSGQPEVTVQQVVDEMRRAGSRYAESTVRTMLTSHMCAQVHGPNVGTYDDVDRVDRGTYRLRA